MGESGRGVRGVGEGGEGGLVSEEVCVSEHALLFEVGHCFFD